MAAALPPGTTLQHTEIAGGELHKFLFEGLPVRGILVRLTGAWTEMLARRQAAGGYPQPVRELLGQMSAAAALMQANIKFNGALILQMQGDGPVKMAVAEAQPDLSLRATATVVGEVPADARIEALLNVHGQGRCAITLDPKDRQPGQQPYQGIVPLHGDHGEPLQQLAEVLEHYMLQSEQLDTKLVLAADDQVAAGLLIQRLPVQGESNLAGRGHLAGSSADEDQIGRNEHYQRIAMLASTLKAEELLGLDVDTILRRLFWEEDLRRFEPQHPRFACTCSRERVSRMLHGLGREEIDSVIAEQGQVEVACEFCGQKYHFDPIDAATLFSPSIAQAGGTGTVQ